MSCSPYLKWFYWRLVLLLLVLLPNIAFSGQIVKFLPGFDGELPFKLETGYVSVGDSELFYYFFESQGDPQENPLLLWLTGGPGCSSFSGLIYEIGPIEFDVDNYKGGLPKLKYYPYALTKTASIIFLDAPVGTGFSYATTPEGWLISDTKSAEQSYEFLIKWLLEHPQYLLVQLFIGGDSYSGITVPLVTQKVVKGNETKVYPYMNLKGYIVGSPLTNWVIDRNSKVVFAHRMSLISDDLYEKLKKSCNENYVNVDSSNTECVTALATYEMCVKDLNTKNILEPKCESLKTNPEVGRRSVKENLANFNFSTTTTTEFRCRDFNFMLSNFWANNPEVQDALHVRKEIAPQWVRCNKSLSYTKDVTSVVNVHKYLSAKGLRLLVETGDHDMDIPYVGTEKWIKSLNLTIIDEWRPWFVNGQVAGYTRKYSKDGFHLTFATVKGGGHTAPEYYRRECYEMFQRWIHYYPL